MGPKASAGRVGCWAHTAADTTSARAHVINITCDASSTATTVLGALLPRTYCDLAGGWATVPASE